LYGCRKQLDNVASYVYIEIMKTRYTADVDGYETKKGYVKTPSGFWHRKGDGFSPEAESAGEVGDKSYEEYDVWVKGAGLKKK
jgi:hypothetical protein